MAALHVFYADCSRKFSSIYGGGDPLLTLKRAAAFAATALGSDALRLYQLPVRELIQWCEVARDVVRARDGGRNNTGNRDYSRIIQ